MADDPLDTQTTHLGMIFGGGGGSEAAPATLTFDDRGARLTVPYLHFGADERFDVIRGWFVHQMTPTCLVFVTAGHKFTLSGIRWAGYRENGNVSLGTLSAHHLVGGDQSAHAQDGLAVTGLQSHMDALQHWTAFTAATYESITDEHGFVERLEATVETTEDVTWTQGDAEMRLTSTWQTNNSLPGFHVNEWAVLQSTFASPRPVDDHMHEHEKIRRLLVVLYGADIPFRRHEIQDERYYPRTGDGHVYSRSGRSLYASRTFRERSRPPVEKGTFQKCVGRLASIGSEGLARWGSEFETWKRVIHPAAAIFGRERAMLEDRVISLSMCLEAAGQILGQKDGEEATYKAGKRPETMATYVYRCLSSLDVSWSDVADSNVGIARAVANNYRQIKHYDASDDFPDGEETFLVSQVAAATVRLLIANIVVPSGELAQNWQSVVGDALQWFESYELRIDASGAFVTSPEARK